MTGCRAHPTHEFQITNSTPHLYEDVSSVARAVLDRALQDAHRPRPHSSAPVQVLGESPDACRSWARGSPALGPKRGVKDRGGGKNASEQHLGAVILSAKEMQK